MSTYTKVNDNEIVVDVKVSNILCNTIKQIMSNHVKTYAIDVVTIFTNESPVFGDIIVQRLGLVPVTIDPKDNDYKDIEFELNYEAKNTIEDIYSNSFSLVTKIGKEVPDGLLEKGIPLFYIHKGQKIHIKAIAKVSVGDDHAKWSPVCATTFKQIDTERCLLKIETTSSKTPIDTFNESIDILKEQVLRIAESV
jgi:DNA-directed RNA polymerase subunit D